MAAKIEARKQYDDWEVEEALRCLQRAKEIERNKKLMAKVQELAKKKLVETAAVIEDAQESGKS